MEVKGIKLISVEFRGSFHGSLLISVQVGVSMQEVDGNLHGSTLKNQVNSVEDRVLSALGDHGWGRLFVRFVVLQMLPTKTKWTWCSARTIWGRVRAYSPKFLTISGGPEKEEIVIYQIIDMRKSNFISNAFSRWTWDSNSRPAALILPTTPHVTRKPYNKCTRTHEHKLIRRHNESKQMQPGEQSPRDFSEYQQHYQWLGLSHCLLSLNRFEVRTEYWVPRVPEAEKTYVAVLASPQGTRSWDWVLASPQGSCWKLKWLSPRESPRLPKAEMTESSRAPRVPWFEMTRTHWYLYSDDLEVLRSISQFTYNGWRPPVSQKYSGQKEVLYPYSPVARAWSAGTRDTCQACGEVLRVSVLHQ